MEVGPITISVPLVDCYMDVHKACTRRVIYYLGNGVYDGVVGAMLGAKSGVMGNLALVYFGTMTEIAKLL